ncbi:MAG: acyl-ACP--UDP-N-acetylglucosamine O-acyltransferase [Solitalea-like symbiont of Acarus siro]
MSNLVNIHSKAQIAKDVKIDPFASIHEDVIIDRGCWIGSNVTFMPGARIGKNCRIFPGAVISAIPQDLKFKGEKTNVIINDNTTIRECVTINRGTSAFGKTIIGSNCLLMAYTHVAHDCIIGDNCVLANSVQIAGHVTIDDWVVIGGITAIHQYSKIGTHAFVAGMSGVVKDIPPYITAGRMPLIYMGLNYIGLKRRNFSSESINNIKSIYHDLFANHSTTLSDINSGTYDIDKSNIEAETIISFIKKSDRGIVGKK